MNKLFQIGNILLLSFMGFALVIVLSLSWVLYSSMYNAEGDKLIQISEASLKPIVNLATRSVNGANKMKLRNKDAQSLYASSGLLYLKIEGMSKASPASAFAKAQPPRAMEYEYRAETGAVQQASIDELLASTHKQFIDTEDYLFLSRSPLDEVENGAQITAVFSALSLEGIQRHILKEMAWPVLVVTVLAAICALLIGRHISKPISDASRQISHISHTLDMGLRVESSSPVIEINGMVLTFNKFLDQVEGIIKQLTELVDHISEASE